MYDFELLNGRWTISKDPRSTLNYGINWAPWLPAGDSVKTATWVVDGVVREDYSIQGNIAFVRLSGGPELGYTGSACCTITTLLGNEIEPQTLYFFMETH